MTDSTVTTVPSTPNPSLQAIVYSLLRSILMLMGALGIGVGANISDGTLMVVAGAIVAVGTAAWSLYDKVQAARKTHAAAVRSAVVAQPVQPAS